MNALQRSPFHGPLFEGFVAAEIVKQQINRGKRRELYYFRDQQGLEVDFIVPKGPASLVLVEVKATRTPKPEMSLSMQRLAASIKRYRTESLLVHGRAEADAAGRALCPGVAAVTVTTLLNSLRTGQN